MATENEGGLEEERRLFYVALTRAEEYAVLSYAKSRYKYGELKFSTPSRFLREIDDKYIDRPNTEMGHPKLKGFSLPTRQPERSPVPSGFKPRVSERESSSPVAFNYQNSTTNYQPGMMVEHERFGRGVIDDIEGTAPNTKVTVTFEHSGKKQLLLKFAKLKILR